MSVYRLWGVALALLCTGCFRLSDPVYAFKPLEADEPIGPEFSLLYGTFEVEGGGLSVSSITSAAFRKLGESEQSDLFYVVGENTLFRVFDRRPMKDGHFLIPLRPGAYELEELRGVGFLGSVSRFHLSEDARFSSRIHITRPGIYVLKPLRITAPQGFFGHYTIEVVEPRDEQKRMEMLRDAVKGTAWEQLLSKGKG